MALPTFGRSVTRLADQSGQEIRQASRRLARTPAFTLAIIATLALAVGANVSIFAVVQRVLLNPLPYPDSDRVVLVQHQVPRVAAPPFSAMPLGIYYQYVDRARTLEAVALFRGSERTITGAGRPERVRVSSVTPSLAAVLRVPPEHGRWFTDASATPGARQTAILSHGLWVRLYDGSPAALGRAMVLDGVPTDIVGVMPASFAFPDARVDVWVADQISKSTGFGLFTHGAIARLRDGVTLADARAEMTRLIADLPKAYPGAPLARTLANELKVTSMAVTLKESTVGAVGRALWFLLAAVLVVLLIACANLANLFLVRSEARQRDLAVRRALGAGQSSLVRYFLAESAVLCLAGSTAGLALAWWAVRLVVRFGPATLPRLSEIHIDAATVGFTAALCLLTAIVFGLVPLALRVSLPTTLHESGRGRSVSRRSHSARRLLMGGQVALALVLLVSSGLMARSFQNLRAIDPGFEADSRLAFNIGLPARTYTTRAAAVAAHQAILDQLSRLPGARAVSASTLLPFGEGSWGNSLRVEGQTTPPGSIPPIVQFRAVAGGYVEAMGMRLVRGRGITRGDVERADAVVVVNQALARGYFRETDPIGQRIQSAASSPTPWLTIVGVTADTPTNALAEASRQPTLYLPISMAGGPDIPAPALFGPDVSVMSYVTHATTSPLNLLSDVRGALDAVDNTLAIAQPRTLQAVLDRAAAQAAFTMVLMVVASALALLLGVVGIYGVISYVVTQRTGEIGLRLAMGADPSGVALMILRQSGMVALAGVATGLVIALAGGRLISNLLYGVSPRDPTVFAATTTLLLVISTLASWLPARRAARLSPLDALRAE